MDAVTIRVSHRGNAKLVAVYPGLPVEELAQLLGSIFGANNAVGFESNGTSIPLRVACQSPQLLAGNEYSLLLGDGAFSPFVALRIRRFISYIFAQYRAPRRPHRRQTC
jgi:hypothetical protein